LLKWKMISKFYQPWKFNIGFVTLQIASMLAHR